VSDEKNPSDETPFADIVDGRFSCYEYGPGDLSRTTLVIHRIEKQRDELARLVSDMLAVLIPPENARLFDVPLSDVVATWRSRFKRFGGDPEKPIPREE
jgi:hypothetical protein